MREENFEKKDEEDDVVMNEEKEPLRGIDFPKGIIIEDVQDKKLCEEPEHLFNKLTNLKYKITKAYSIGEKIVIQFLDDIELDKFRHDPK